jgi:hypothetical protein
MMRNHLCDGLRESARRVRRRKSRLCFEIGPGRNTAICDHSCPQCKEVRRWRGTDCPMRNGQRSRTCFRKRNRPAAMSRLLLRDEDHACGCDGQRWVGLGLTEAHFPSTGTRLILEFGLVFMLCGYDRVRDRRSRPFWRRQRARPGIRPPALPGSRDFP